ncbi:BRAP2 RING ZnF UBP domain-containing protein 2 [Citrus sinensis]|nr:BRAP2 RING ZnF UBP domain-containing protein 2 [Citrus sinensis]
MSSSSSTAVVAGDDEPFRQPLPEMISDDASAFDNAATQTFAFSSGNPRIEETRGVMHLFSSSSSDNSNDGVVSSPSPNRNLPVGRKPLVCVLGVPNHMTYADFCQFCASFIQHILEMRIVRTDGMDDQYSVLIRFDSQDSADKFYQHFNGRQFNSLEEEVCHVLFTVDVQFTGYTGSLEHVQPAPASSTEQPSCPVCLVEFSQLFAIILSIALVSQNGQIRLVQCADTASNSQKNQYVLYAKLLRTSGCVLYVVLWAVGEHCYSLELETQRVWDYAGDNYVHRLIQSKTDGKLVELNSHCLHGKDNCGSCDCVDSGTSDALLSSKVEAIVNEYNELLAAQLENQKIYYETLLQEAKEETEKIISEAVKKAIAQKLQKMQAKLDRCVREKKFLDDLNENLLKNQEMWKAKISEIEEREKMALRAKDDKIQDSEAQLRDLMVYLEAEKTLQQLSISNEIKDGTVLPMHCSGLTFLVFSLSSNLFSDLLVGEVMAQHPLS